MSKLRIALRYSGLWPCPRKKTVALFSFAGGLKTYEAAAIQKTGEEGRGTLKERVSDYALRGRIGAYRQHATHDAKETTQKARETFLGRFEREVDPNLQLPQEERVRRAQAARKAYFAKLSRQSALARRKPEREGRK